MREADKAKLKEVHIILISATDLNIYISKIYKDSVYTYGSCVKLVNYGAAVWTGDSTSL